MIMKLAINRRRISFSKGEKEEEKREERIAK